MSHTLKQSILLFSILFYVAGCGQKSDLGGASPGGNPKVILTNPANEAVNFSADSLDNPQPVRVMFDRDMNSTSVRTNSFLLTACNVEIPHTSDSPSYDPDTRTVTIVPKKLDPNQQYLVYVSRSATDESGNPLSPELFLRFTTGEHLDRYAPKFEGLQNPIDVNSSTELTLHWTAAVDSFDQATLPEDMEYRIYQGIGSSSGSCQVIFTRPFRTLKSQKACQALNQNNLPVECSYQVNGDQWSHRITGLSASTGYCFVVRARDLGCHEEPNRTARFATTKVGGKMYVANLGANNLLVYDNAGQAESVAPRGITSDQTQLNVPIGLALGNAMDPVTSTTKKSLYVANFSSNKILAYDWQDGAQIPCPASGLVPGSSFPTGDLPPCRVFEGSQSLLSRPIGLFMDNLSDKLYVTNYLSNAIVVFSNVSAISNVASPPRSILITSNPANILPYDNPIGIAVDTNPNRDALYVAYQKTGSDDIEIIGIVDKISTKGYGTIAPTRFISGLGQATNNTRLSNPAGLWLDPDQDQGRLYVANRGTRPDNTDDAILVFDQVSSANGNVSPTWIITGADSKNPLFNEPYMLSMVSYIVPGPNNTPPITKHRLFVANSGNGKILVFDDIDAALNPTQCKPDFLGVPICSLTPNLVVEGTMTHLFTPRAVVAEHHDDPIDPLGSDALYIANASPLIAVGQHFTFSINAFENVTLPPPPSDSSTPRLEKKPDRVISPSINGPTGVVVDKEKQKLYLSSIIGDSISVFDNVNDVNTTGNIRPTRRIFGPATGLSGPAGIALAGDRLYAANLFTSEILEFDLNDLDNSDVCKPPPGGFAPDCDISPVSISSYTESGISLASPLGIVIDPGSPGNELLYVTYRDQTFSDNRGDSIVVFKRNADGGFSPLRRIKSSNPPLVGPSGLYLDPIRSELYVANRSANTILVFDLSNLGSCDNNSVPVCNLNPIRIITQNADKGPSKSLSNPNWIFLDYLSDPNKLYVTNRAVTTDGESFIFVYDDAQTVNGNTLPVRSIGGLLSPVSLFLDPER